MTPREGRRAHPANILIFVPKLPVLLALPLLRAALALWRGGFAAWLAGAWMDLVFLGVVLLPAVLRWRSIRYRYDEEGIVYSAGVLHRRRVVISAGRLSNVAILSPWWLRPLGVVQLRADTRAGRIEQADFTLYLPGRQAEEIFRRRAMRYDEGPLYTYAPGHLSVALLSVISSNSLAGLLLLVTLVSNLGELVGEEISQRVVGTLNHLGRALAFGIPPAAAALGYLLLFGWLVAFSAELTRNLRFRAQRLGGVLSLGSGLLTHRSDSVEVESIDFIDIRETVFSRLLGMGAVYVHAPGLSGRRGGEVAAVIPVMRNAATRRHHAALLPELVPTPRQLCPNPGALRHFLRDPALCMGAALFGTLLLLRRFSGWGETALFLGGMCMAPILWFLAVRLLDFRSAGLSREGAHYTLRYSSGFYLHTVVLPAGRIAGVRFRQGPWQRRSGRCDVYLSTFSQGRRVHHLRSLPLQEVEKLFDLL